MATAPPAVTAPGAPVEEQSTMAAANSTPVALPAGWTTVDWEGLVVPVPPGYVTDTTLPVEPELAGYPILSRLVIMRDPATVNPVFETPPVMLLDMLQFAGGPAAWLDYLRQTTPYPIDEPSVRATSVAGSGAVAYLPTIPGAGDPEFYVLEPASGRLLVLSGDRGFPEHQQTIAAIMRSDTLVP